MAGSPEIVRLDGQQYRIVGETTIDGVPHHVLVPLKGKGPLRAHPVALPPAPASARQEQPVEHSPPQSAAFDERTRPPEPYRRLSGAKQPSPIHRRSHGHVQPSPPGQWRALLWLLAVLGVLTLIFG